jgi:hypothetical protein
MSKTVLVTIAVAGLGLAGTYFYLQRTPPPPPPPAPSPVARATPPRHLALPGTYFLLRYRSVTTDSGVTGFPPGTKVSLLRQSDQTMHVTDGNVEFDVSPGEVTNDLDIAARIARNDSRSQAQAANLAAAQANSIWIVQAVWGVPGRTIDVTAKLQAQVAAGDTVLRASSSTLGGELAYGQTKTLTVTYAVGTGAPVTETIKEGQSIPLPTPPPSR